MLIHRGVNATRCIHLARPTTLFPINIVVVVVITFLLLILILILAAIPGVIRSPPVAVGARASGAGAIGGAGGAEAGAANSGDAARDTRTLSGPISMMQPSSTST
jgi:hypothetical protein